MSVGYKRHCLSSRIPGRERLGEVLAAWFWGPMLPSFWRVSPAQPGVGSAPGVPVPVPQSGSFPSGAGTLEKWVRGYIRTMADPLHPIPPSHRHPNAGDQCPSVGLHSAWLLHRGGIFQPQIPIAQGPAGSGLPINSVFLIFLFFPISH